MGNTVFSMKQLQRARRRARLKPSELDELAGLRRGTFALLAMSGREPSEETLRRYASALGVKPSKFYEKREQLERDREPPCPGTEREPYELRAWRRGQQEVWRASASFVMNDRGGLHVRPAVMLQKCLDGLDFIYAEATCNGRAARRYGPSAGPLAERVPAFWLLLLRLEARQGATVRFTVFGSEAEEAEEALMKMEDVFSRPKPDRRSFARKIGAGTFFKTYLQEAWSPQERELRKRYQLYGKQYSSMGAPNEGPMGTKLEGR